MNELDEFEIENEDMFDDFDGDMISTLIDISATTALKLTELVVDNNHRNGTKMTNGDIYQIHADSFAAAFASLAQAAQQE